MTTTRRAAIEAAIRAELTDWALEVEAGGTPHSWRCQHPHLHVCTCLDDMATDMTTAVLKALAGALDPTCPTCDGTGNTRTPNSGRPSTDSLLGVAVDWLDGVAVDDYLRESRND